VNHRPRPQGYRSRVFPYLCIKNADV